MLSLAAFAWGLVLITLILPVPLWMHRSWAGGRRMLGRGDNSAKALPVPTHVRGAEGVISEARVLRGLVGDALRSADECIALWPYVWVASVHTARINNSETWAAQLLETFYGRVADARNAVWQWVKRVDNMPDGSRAELERLGLEIEAARRFVVSDASQTGAPVALALFRTPRSRDVRLLRQQLVSIITEFDRFEACLRHAPSTPYR